MTLELVWFGLVALSFAVYVVLDGFDLGAGILHRYVARTAVERRLVTRSIGPVWDGNEVWLLAAGGTVFFAFPKLYANGIAGFYLPVTILMWLLVFRALGIEMKHQLSNPLWDELWDSAFFLSSLTITLFLGVALGNMVRGMTLDASGRFFAPLWTDLGVNGEVGILDWFTILVGLGAVAGVTLHGALWLAHRVEGPVGERAGKLVRPLLAATTLGVLLATASVFNVRPDLAARLGERPQVLALPLVALGSLVAIGLFAHRGAMKRAFGCSCAFLGAMVLTAAASIYPHLLVSRPGGDGLLVSAGKTSDYGLRVGLVWWIPGTLLAISYFVYLYRSLPATLTDKDVEHEHHD